jgi:yeast amino acid transporter
MASPSQSPDLIEKKSNFVDRDQESNEFKVKDSPFPQQVKLQRQLKNRHVAMISIGGVIGTGLFLGTATSLKNGGPVGLLLGYSLVGSICFAVMISLGEMIAYLPVVCSILSPSLPSFTFNIPARRSH